MYSLTPAGPPDGEAWPAAAAHLPHGRHGRLIHRPHHLSQPPYVRQLPGNVSYIVRGDRQ